jgi:putative two-component system response regulator
MTTMTSEQKKYTVLVVDDLPQNLDVMKGILLPEYDVRLTTKPKSVITIAKAVKPDIILLDIMMPEINGYQVCQQLKADPETQAIPVIFVSAMTDVKDEQKGFDLGAVDYITKPVVEAIVKARVNTHLLLSDQMRATQRLVAKKTKELEQSQRSAIFMLGEAGHYNDNDTGVHIWRMAAYAGALARAALWTVEQVELIELASPMHDTGKIGISDDILKAPRKLTEEEMAIMRTHAKIGYRILSKSQTPLFEMAAIIALHHHEKWDGSGYPDSLVAEQIPEAARIVAIADVFDALTMKRPYKKSWPTADAFDFIEQQSGAHFDPHLVQLFLSIKDEILALKAKYDEMEQGQE